MQNVTVKFHWIPNMCKFLEMAARSCGEVLLDLPDGSRADLKRDGTARQLLGMLQPGETGLRVRLSDRGDMAAFMRYMSEAAL